MKREHTATAQAAARKQLEAFTQRRRAITERAAARLKRFDDAA